MRWYRFAGALLLAFATCAALAAEPGGVATPVPPAPQQDLYLDAMRSLSEGRQNDASDALSKMVTLEPMHAGAWLDLAIIQCELGHAQEAERLFEAIVTRFAPPPEILEVIASNRLRGCAGWRPTSKLSVLLGRGADSNVNQGASSPTFTFGLGPNIVEAQLLPEYLPRRDQFSVLQADYSRDLNANGTVGSVQVQARINDRLKQYDAAAVVAGIERPFRAGSWGVRGLGSFGLLTLGGKLYQAQALLQARIMPALPLPENMQLTFTPGIAHVHYPTLTNYDANTLELRSQAVWKLPQVDINASVAYLTDFAVAARPGGDRRGWASSIRASKRLGGNLFGELGWTRQTWQSQSSYSPGLIETVRQQDMNVVRGTLVYPIQARQTLQLELRSVRNTENISIFQYNSRQLQLSWQWQNF